MPRHFLERLRRSWGNPGPFEFSAALICFAAVAAAKLWSVLFYRFDSDEPQHLHVVWAWTQGLVQYRDVFDNHMPFFQILCAPLFGSLGEHARDLYLMRFLMLPLFVVSGVVVFRLARLLFSRRVAAWSVIALGLSPSYFLCSTEFRTDNLWAVFWLLSLYVLARGALRWRRTLVAGLLLGLAFAVSMKSTLLLLTVLAAGGMALLALGGGKKRLRRSVVCKCLPALLVGVVLPPLSIFAFFAAKGSWPQMRYCVFEHNLGAHYSAPALTGHLLLLVAGLVLAMALASRLALTARHPLVAFRRAFLGAASGAYLALLFGLWNHVTRQDYLPFYPMAAIVSIGVLRELAPKMSRRKLQAISFLRWPAPAVGLALALSLSLTSELPRVNQAAREIRMVHDVLALTDDDQYVLDCKGETVFRPRAVYAVFESLTNARLRTGLLEDKVAQGCVAAHACVAVVKGRLPDEGKAFINQNYLSVGDSVRVAGCWLDPDSPDGDEHFEIAIPARYEVIAKEGKVRGWLDGVPYEGSRFLAPGPHDFRPESSEGRLAILWAPAVARHFSPFAPSAHSVSILSALKGALGRNGHHVSRHS